MRYPEFLKDNGTLGFVAPSFGCTTEPYKSLFQNALQRFETMGLHTKVGNNVFSSCGIGISNSPQKCGEEVNSFYEDEEVDLLFSAGGGELMCEVVPYIDFARLKNAKAKWYIGYSDNTNFTFLSTTLMDTAAIYGPCAGEFGQEPLHESHIDTLALAKGMKFTFSQYSLWEKEKIKDENHPLNGFHLTEETKTISYQYEKAFTGRLIGGCLDCLANLCGTRFDQVKEFSKKYKEDGTIWFLEACDLNVMSIRRALWELSQAGWFDTAKGFLIGRPVCHGTEMMGLDHYSAVTGILGNYGVPILMDLDIGHMSPQIPMLSGAIATAELDADRFKITYQLT